MPGCLDGDGSDRGGVRLAAGAVMVHGLSGRSGWDGRVFGRRAAVHKSRLGPGCVCRARRGGRRRGRKRRRRAVGRVNWKRGAGVVCAEMCQTRGRRMSLGGSGPGRTWLGRDNKRVHSFFLIIMQSLRSRRPSESRPVKRNVSKLAKTPSTRQNARKSTVDDKMKKRMSLRYAEISSPTEASVPAVPTIPLGLRPGAPRDRDEIVLDIAQVKEDPRALDQRLLDKDDFNPDDCESHWTPNLPLTNSITRPQSKTCQLDRGRTQVSPVLSPLPQG